MVENWNFVASEKKHDSKKSRGDIGLEREKKETGKFFGCKSALTHNGKSFPRDRKGEKKGKIAIIDRECALATHTSREESLGKSSSEREGEREGKSFNSFFLDVFFFSAVATSPLTKLWCSRERFSTEGECEKNEVLSEKQIKHTI